MGKLVILETERVNKKFLEREISFSTIAEITFERCEQLIFREMFAGVCFASHTVSEELTRFPDTVCPRTTYYFGPDGIILALFLHDKR